MAIRFPLFPAFILAVAAGAGQVEARKLLVGPGKTYAKPMAAAAQAADGDTVEIDPGLYEGEVATWRAHNLVLRGTAKFARLKAPASISNGKAIWVIQGTNTTVENIEFFGAAVPDKNGAGIRQEGDGLTVRHCYFHDNENGILGGGGPTSEVVIEHSEFASNGNGDGFSHNLYIANIGAFTLRFCASHHAKVGHNVKSRAGYNFLLYNRIWDGTDGTASLEVDLPNGGVSFVIGNIIQQGPATQNSALLSYGAEGLSNPGTSLYLVNNTLVNDRSAGTFIQVRQGATATVWNNILAGPGTAIGGTADTADNWIGSDPGFLDRAKYDYRIGHDSPARDIGRSPGAVSGYALSPAFQYVPDLRSMPRPNEGALDAGAYEAGTVFPSALRRPPGLATARARSLGYPMGVNALGRSLPAIRARAPEFLPAGSR